MGEIDLVKDYDGIEVVLIDKFAVVKETLERIGIINEKKKKIFPSCYLLKDDDDKYRVYHFKQLFAKDGHETSYNLIDEIRLKTVVHFIDRWGLVTAIDDIDRIMQKRIDIIPYAKKKEYQIVHKYKFMTRKIENKEIVKDD